MSADHTEAVGHTEYRAPLLPDRHPQGDFFICDIFDAVPKADMASMEHPVFSLATKPDTRVREYTHNGATITIKPSVDGLATVHDRDVLIYCISQLMAAINAGKEVTQLVRFHAFDLLVATNRNTAGSGYDQLKAALERLSGTRISTNIVTGGTEIFRTFGLIESAEIVRKTRDGRMQEIEVKLSDWVFNAIRSKEVLTLHRNYFRLRKPLERRMYELARKHCGAQAEWRISLELLQKKCGSSSTPREFRRLVSRIIQEDQNYEHMPDYAVAFDEDTEVVIFRNRHGAKLAFPTSGSIAYNDHWLNLKREAGCNKDNSLIASDFRRFCRERNIPLNAGNIEKLFSDYCRKIGKL